MENEKTAGRRHPTCLRILSHFPILVQDKLAKIGRGRRAKKTTVYLSTVTIVIRETKRGVVTVEFKPP